MTGRRLDTGMPTILNDFETELGQLIEKHKAIGIDAQIEGLDLYILNLSFKQDSPEVAAGLAA